MGLFDKLASDLRAAGAGEMDFDGARIDLASLRKGFKLRRHAHDLIGQPIERGRPRLIGMFFLARDPCSDARDKEHRNKARRLRSHLLELREKIVGTIRAEIATVIRTARLE